MYMSVQIDERTPFLKENRMMRQNDIIVNNHLMLVLYDFKEPSRALEELKIILIVIATYKNNVSIESVQQPFHFIGIDIQHHISKMIHQIVFTHNRIPSLNHLFIHLHCIRKGTVLVLNDSVMKEMRIRCNPSSFLAHFTNCINPVPIRRKTNLFVYKPI